MERKSIDEILLSAKTGRAVSPAGVANAASSLLYTPIKEMAEKNKGDEENDEPRWSVNYARMTGISTSGLYAESLVGMRKMLGEGGIDSTIYMFLAALAMAGTRPVKMWMNTSVEDAMKEAGLERDFEEWLEEDVRAWERLKGKAPNIGDVMQRCFDAFTMYCKEELWVFPPGEVKVGFFEEIKVTDPFVRYAEGAYILVNGYDEMEQFIENYTKLVCKWVWLLMHQAPLAVCNKKIKK